MWRVDLHTIKRMCTVFIPCGLFLLIILTLIPIQIHPFAYITNTPIINISAVNAATWYNPATWISPEDWFNSILSTILGLFISIAAGFLTVAGIGFDAAINYTILNFSQSFIPFQNGIYVAWSTFRDLGNIILIAMFVYLAFNVILNIKTYGLEKFGVRILIVALLMNFSLFFTEAIIDVSNITAIAFYKSMTITSVKPPAGSNNTVTSTNTMGISNAFMQSTGLSSALNGGDVVKQIIEKGGDKGGGYGPAFMYTLLVVIFFFALSGVFIFALILLITRMIAFIVLLPLSALAFAAYITPNGDQLWNKWLGSLTSNALFAPVFMALLWGVIKIIQSPQDLNSKQPLQLDKMLTDQGVWSAAFMMIIIIALLYAATIIAHSLSLHGASVAKRVGVGATGVGHALKGGVAIRNLAAKHASPYLAKIPGFRGLAAQLNTVSKNKLEDTTLGKGLAKHGMTFSTDQSAAIATHQVEIQKKEAGIEVSKDIDREVSSLKSMESSASILKETAESEHENISTRVERDNVIDSSQLTIAVQVKKEQELEMHKEDRKVNDSSLSKSTRRNARAAADRAEAEIAKQDVSIAELTKSIQERQQTLATSKEKVDSTKTNLLDIRAKITTEQSDKHLQQLTSERTKEKINNFSWLGKSVKEIALSKVGETELDRISKAIKNASDKKE